MCVLDRPHLLHELAQLAAVRVPVAQVRSWSHHKGEREGGRKGGREKGRKEGRKGERKGGRASMWRSPANADDRNCMTGTD